MMLQFLERVAFVDALDLLVQVRQYEVQTGNAGVNLMQESLIGLQLIVRHVSESWEQLLSFWLSLKIPIFSINSFN